MTQKEIHRQSKIGRIFLKGEISYVKSLYILDGMESVITRQFSNVFFLSLIFIGQKGKDKTIQSFPKHWRPLFSPQGVSHGTDNRQFVGLETCSAHILRVRWQIPPSIPPLLQTLQRECTHAEWSQEEHDEFREANSASRGVGTRQIGTSSENPTDCNVSLHYFPPIKNFVLIPLKSSISGSAG